MTLCTICGVAPRALTSNLCAHCTEVLHREVARRPLTVRDMRIIEHVARRLRAQEDTAAALAAERSRCAVLKQQVEQLQAHRDLLEAGAARRLRRRVQKGEDLTEADLARLALADLAQIRDALMTASAGTSDFAAALRRQVVTRDETTPDLVAWLIARGEETTP